MSSGLVVALSGGVGGAKLALGLSHVLPPDELLVVANTVNIGADLGGMADATQMVTGVSAFFWTPFYAFTIIALLFWLSYRRIARIFKWLTLVLFAYVATAFEAHADWGAVLRSTSAISPWWSLSNISAGSTRCQ